jgi:hypothetical protein
MLALMRQHLARGMNKTSHELMNLEDGLTRHLGETEGFAITSLKPVSE